MLMELQITDLVQTMKQIGKLMYDSGLIGF
jgi:hypothetical protein